MSGPAAKTWQAIESEVRRRIHTRVWAPGDMIPNEQDLADEFGCARATVNRALRSLSDAGLLERRRKAGTRVALHPVRKATLSIPIIRKEIAARGQKPGYRRLLRRSGVPPRDLLERLGGDTDGIFLHVQALHTADGAPFVFEDRWINLDVVPEAAEQPFDEISANEWLVRTAAFTDGEIAFSASAASDEAADHLQCDPGAAIFTIERITRDGTRPITLVWQYYRPGFRMQTTI
ncbi:GntR family transcriptional regulator [Roseovarius amoyensis]|uniref:GntR family transcriptional regulator n=1 Tax=Roseovarius amoyensis TaxID=2211448 RepID=UPI000DBE610B|nr:GntR family transcriptional regulator [Roseovarius amoyensis]